MTTLQQRLALGLVAGSALFAATPAFADDPLMGKSPWNFTPQNRAAIAIAIKGVEDGNNGGNGGAGTIVCGGTSGASGQGATGSGASSTANSSCIIINNSDGAIVTNPQYSDGNQDSDSEANSTLNNANSKKSGSIDDVAAILGGNKQGL
jgi:hypothetical protein